MKIFGVIERFLFLVGLSLVPLTPAGAISQPTDVVSVVGTASHWGAMKWSAQDLARFGGMPRYAGERKNMLLLRYSFFATQYDGDRIAPLWVAHIDQEDGLRKTLTRTDKYDLKWHRLPGFFVDRNVADFALARRIPIAVDDSYTNCNPPELPGTPGAPTDVTRGHGASNLEMKVQGSEAEGVVSQHESFSLANVMPQMQRHNAPMWAELENDCLVWGSKLGGVAVITGPVYRQQTRDAVTRAELPAPVSRQLFIQGTKGPRIEMPTHFFKVIIGRMDGKHAAIGFLVPHVTTLDKDGYKAYAVPIAQIEKATNLTFMPDAEMPAFKDAVDHRWIPLLAPIRAKPRRPETRELVR